MRQPARDRERKDAPSSNEARTLCTALSTQYDAVGVASGALVVISLTNARDGHRKAPEGPYCNYCADSDLQRSDLQ
eukprot:9468845-Pyramimonas_sp.AAC.1